MSRRVKAGDRIFAPPRLGATPVTTWSTERGAARTGGAWNYGRRVEQVDIHIGGKWISNL